MCDMGQLIPVMCDECIPGDVWKMGNQAIVRANPLVSPFLHHVDLVTHTFFVPYRLLWDGFEDYITSGEDGTDSSTIPTWDPTPYTPADPGPYAANGNGVGSLWDYLGFPVEIDPEGARPVIFSQYAYNLIWNEFYRDENLQDEVLLTNEDILLSNWEKDYFTSALTSTQKGTMPSLPISGTTSAEWDSSDFVQSNASTDTGFNTVSSDSRLWTGANATAFANAQSFFNANEVDLSVATSFDMSDLRLAIKIQIWMERNNRAGNRYTEFLKAHFGISPRDDRLQRPEYIGGSRSPIIISEVLQTSSTDVTSPQGNLAGHGMGVNKSFTGTYRVKEFGCMMTIAKLIPKAAYQQGVNRQWIKETRYDFYFPEFANISEQAILNAEIFAKDNDSAYNQTVFGYQGRYDEHRQKMNMVVSQMRDEFDHWHLARQWTAGSPPTMNSDFLQCVPSKRVFATPSEPGFIVQFGNQNHVFRPMPRIAEPSFF